MKTIQPRYTNLSSIEPHQDYPLRMYYADEVDARIAELERERDQALADLRVARAAYAALTHSVL